MHENVKNAIDEIDAAIFSGDTFIDDDEREEMEKTLAKWRRGLVGHAETSTELKKDLPSSCDGCSYLINVGDGESTCIEGRSCRRETKIPDNTKADRYKQ